MNQKIEKESIFNRIDGLSAQETLGLLEAAVNVLQKVSPIGESLDMMPSQPLRELLEQALLQKGLTLDKRQLTELTSGNENSIRICKQVLHEIKQIPQLAGEIEQTWTARRKMMAVEPVSWLLAGAFLVLALKIKEIDVGKGTAKFYKLSDKAVESIAKLLGIDGKT